MTIEFCSEGYAELLQCDVESLVGANLLQIFPPFKQTRSYEAYQKVLSTGKTAHTEGWMGSRYMVAHVHAAPWGLTAFATEMTEHRRAMEASAAGSKNQEAVLEEQRHHLVLEASLDVIWEWDIAANRYRHAGPLRQVLATPPEGDEPAFVETVERTHPDERNHIEHCLRELGEKGTPLGERFRLKRFNGSWASVEIRGKLIRDLEGKPFRAIGSLRDVSEQVRLQEQLQQAQKIENVGRLAGGIAHDFNNVLTGIIGNIELALSRGPLDPKLQRNLDQMRKGADRAANLTRQLLAFARKQVADPRVVNLNDLIHGMEKLVRLREDIEVRNLLAPALGAVHIDPNQFEQVMMNMIVNARDAMPNGGTLTIETRNVSRETDSYDAEFPAGEYVATIVKDTGTGMPAEVKAHLFEPFFTTKELGKGTGLGLATCWGIVKQNRGHIVVKSAPGQGTAFEVYLPRVAEKPETVPDAPKIAPSVPTGTETVLLVEDDPLVRQIVSTQLNALGYKVVEASTPDAAIVLARDTKNPIQLLLTDMVMPGMKGHALTKVLREARPRLPAIIMSGYSEESIPVSVEGQCLFLPKPFTILELAQKLRAALDSTRG